MLSEFYLLNYLLSPDPWGFRLLNMPPAFTLDPITFFQRLLTLTIFCTRRFNLGIDYEQRNHKIVGVTEKSWTFEGFEHFEPKEF